jgi:hypothetical protein
VDLLELREPWENGSFQSVQLDDHTVINFAGPPVVIQPQHFAFLVTEEHFDRVQSRFDAEGIAYTADPPGSRPHEVSAVNSDGTGRRVNIQVRGGDRSWRRRGGEVLARRRVVLIPGGAAVIMRRCPSRCPRLSADRARLGTR